MPWPTPQDYNEAIQNPQHSFADAELASGTPEVTALGLPRPITGNFASVYRMRCAGKDWAVRCFWREYADMRERYEAISRHLASAHLPYTVGFEYLTQGIRIRGVWYPIVKMEWVQGELLNEYVERNLSNPRALGDLAQRWVKMAVALESASSAHGDLQHGNVLIVNGDFKLVDYDAMYVPALTGRGSHEIGHQNYQHPRRTGRDFGPTMDRFSAWVIYVSLRALQADPGMWQTLHGGDECLVLRKVDFARPTVSTALKILQTVGDAQLRECVGKIGTFASGDLSRIPSLGDTLAPVRVPVTRAGSARVGAGWRLIAPSTRVAHTMGGHLLGGTAPVALGQSPVAAQAVGGHPLSGAAPSFPSWLADHVRAESHAQQSFGPPTRVLRLSIVCSSVVLGIVFVAAMLSVAPALPILLGICMCLLVVESSIFLIAFNREPVVRAMRELLRDESRELRALRGIERAVDRQSMELDRAGAWLTSELRALENERATLQERERLESNAALKSRDAALSACDERVQEVNTREADALTSSLADIQARHIRTFLSRCSIRTAEIEHVGWGLKMRLWAAAVRTAGDLTSEKMRALQWLGEDPLLALAAWRVDAERDARRGMPQSLSTASRDRVSAPFERARERIASERARAVEAERAGSAAIRQHYQRKVTMLDARTQEAHRRHADRCIEAEGLIEEARQPVALHNRRLTDVQARLVPFQSITFARFLLHELAPWIESRPQIKP